VPSTYVPPSARPHGGRPEEEAGRVAPGSDCDDGPTRDGPTRDGPTQPGADYNEEANPDLEPSYEAHYDDEARPGSDADARATLDLRFVIDLWWRLSTGTLGL
jgi:hypothetical protein